MARPNSSLGRRSFLARAAALGAITPLTGVALASCYDGEDATPTVTPASGGATPTPATPLPTQLPGTPAPEPTETPHETLTPTASPGVMTADEMDASAEAKVKAFLDNIGKERWFPDELPFTQDGDVKVFEITIDEIEWETEPGVTKEALGFNGKLPGGEIRVTEDDKVRVIFHNNLKESTTIHWHGVNTPNDQDGVPYVTQQPIKAGTTYAYEFTATPPGTHMYHSHHNATDQVGRGLLGPFIIEPKDKSIYPEHDREYIIVLNDGLLGFTLNGKGFPLTQPLTAKVGEKILVRYMNEGLAYHPMHLHGMPQQVVAIDGYPLSNPYFTDTVSVPPGNRYDVLIEARAKGLWAFHCHVLAHAERPDGMFGMVTVLAIE